jgi:glycosyltransferase involved in cell wall biosynthesis
MTRIAHITDAHFPDYYWLVSHLEKLAIRRADGVVALNDYTQKKVSPQARHVWVVPNAVSPSFFDIIRHVEPGLAICVAGIHPWKRQVELMEMLDDVPPGQRPQRLVFIGEASADDYGTSFTNAVAARSTWCEHTGSLEIGILQEWISRAELLILPSIEDNCPMVVLEAMAAGLPVIASSIGGIPELVKDNVTGRCFDPYDVNNVRAILSESLADSCRLAAWGKAGRNEAMRSHHPQVVARQHLELYREAVARYVFELKN